MALGAEVTRDDIAEVFLGKGYFPKELPPTFTTRDFGLHHADILAEWERKGLFSIRDRNKAGKRARYKYTLQDTEAEIVSLPKRGFERRNLHITHPLPQALLTKEIAYNWRTIQKWLSKRTYSTDVVNISRNSARAVSGINFDLHSAKKSMIESTNDWIVRTDISRFYPTIYTHSITWAAYGKSKVKDNVNGFANTLADRLDLLVRKCNRNQTIGIPIGPDTSRVIAEIISSRIDDDLKAEFQNLSKFDADRLQDDWTIGAKSLDEAEGILSGIVRSYRSYGLDINGSKTSISTLSMSSHPKGFSELYSFLQSMKQPFNVRSLNEFIQLTLSMFDLHKDESIIAYSLSVIESRASDLSNISTLESFLLKAASIAPASLDRVGRILINLDRGQNALSKSRVSDRLHSLLDRHLEQRNSFEVIWLCHILRGLKYPIKSKCVSEHAVEWQSSALPIVLLDMESKGLVRHRLNKAHWEAMFTASRIESDWTWLLAYEGIRNGWLRDTKGLMRGRFFAPMLARSVKFYDPTKNVLASSAVSKARWSSFKVRRLEINNLLRLMRNVGFEDYS